MEIALRAALIDWLEMDEALSGLNAVVEETPRRAELPWLAIAASASTDWSTKEAAGREVRIALELHCRGDALATGVALLRAIEERVATLPSEQDGFTVVTSQFVRSRAEQRAANTRAMLLEYRFRLLAS